MSFLRQLPGSLFPYRWWLLTFSMCGLLLSLAVIYFARSPVGFALAGPLTCTPWGLICVARSKLVSLTAFFLMLSAVGLVWPFVVLLG
jgi:hypothetical protein